jgi:ribulose-5-phosphate 4-epimerase/fuculose-1-phosphate aldolase
MKNADIAFLGNHGVVVCGDSVAYAYDDLYYVERACMVEVLAQRTGLPLQPVPEAMAAQVELQTRGERLQADLFFEALRRTL